MSKIYKTAELKERLETLYEDLTITTKDAEIILDLLSDATSDKHDILSNLYFKENSPLKVINTQFMPKGDGDTTGEMIDLSLKYDEYLTRLQNKAKSIIVRHQEAVEIFFALMDLENDDYSNILYLRYIKRYATQEIWDKLHMSRPKYFRDHGAAIEALKEKINSKESDTAGSN